MRRRLLACYLFGGVAVLTLLTGCRPTSAPATGPATRVARPPRLSPDYTGLTIPPNLAPLNFCVREPGTAYQVAVTTPAGTSFTVSSTTPQVRFPLAAWRAGLQGRGELRFVVRVLGAGGQWSEFAPVINRLGPPIDGYLIYRFIRPIYSSWLDVGVYERNLANFHQRPVLRGERFGEGCLNCHTFPANQTDRMTLGIRSETYGNSTLLAGDGKVRKLGQMWGYNSWHPSGQAIAYSLNKVRQFFHDAGQEVRDVVDLDSDLMVYRVDSGTVETAPSIAEPRRLETYPTWSPDGKYLYFCSAPILWHDASKVPPPNYRQVRYDLRRVAYDVQTHRFGPAETVLAAAETGHSLLLPRISPDGRWLLFCMCEYGCFPIYQPSSDLYLMDLRTRRYHKLSLNSNQSESWHSWSSDGRWIAFSSKRQDGVFTRTYLAAVDEQGGVSKPFVVPQEDPTYYDSLLKTYSVPELVKAPVPFAPRALARAARDPRGAKPTLPEVSMTRKETKPAPAEPWTSTPPR